MDVSRVLELLYLLEWSGTSATHEGEESCCPYCRMWSGEGHENDCELANVIDALERVG
jgi:hypothetical protein